MNYFESDAIGNTVYYPEYKFNTTDSVSPYSGCYGQWVIVNKVCIGSILAYFNTSSAWRITNLPTPKDSNQTVFYYYRSSISFETVSSLATFPSLGRYANEKCYIILNYEIS